MDTWDRRMNLELWTQLVKKFKFKEKGNTGNCEQSVGIRPRQVEILNLEPRDSSSRFRPPRRLGMKNKHRHKRPRPKHE